jgi:hypothetical protein
MSMTFDPSGDLQAVADQLEPIKFRRRGMSSFTLVPHALRRRIRLREARSSDGHVLQSETVWHLPAGELLVAPRLGDLIVDAQDQMWTILDIERTDALGSWRLLSRNLAVAAGLDQLVTVEQAIPAKSSAGDLQPNWIPIWSGVRAKIQPANSLRKELHDQQSILERFDATLADNLPITQGHRVVDMGGTIYKVVGIEMPERIDQLLLVRVVRWSSIEQESQR